MTLVYQLLISVDLLTIRAVCDIILAKGVSAMESIQEEFERLRDEHEALQLKLNLHSLDETYRYLDWMMPIEKFFKRLYISGEVGDFWDHANYYYEKYRFNFQFAQSNISVARHFRYDRHRSHEHDFFQVNYCLKGSCQVVIDEHTKRLAIVRMQSGDFNILSPETPHYVWVNTDDCVVIKYYIRKSTFEKAFFALLEEDDILSDFFRNAIRGKRDTFINFRTGGDADIERLALTIYMDLMNHKPCFGILSESRLTELFCLMVRDHSNDASIRDESGRGESSARIYAYLRDNYRDVTFEKTARYFGYSKSYLCRYMQKTTGKTFSRLVNEVRIAEAKKLLASERCSVMEVGRMVGYASDEHFHRVFKEFVGVTPRAWRTSL